MIFVEEKPYPEASVKAECQETEGDSQECASEMRTGSNWSEEDQWTYKKNPF